MALCRAIAPILLYKAISYLLEYLKIAFQIIINTAIAPLREKKWVWNFVGR
ncbi:MAG: hypothetical protein ACFFG0_18270 [Candidatus Thorarchaeota archaeon]